MSSDIDVLCLGHYVLEKDRQFASVAVAADQGAEAPAGELWASPCCQSDLVTRGEELACAECGQTYAVEEGIPLLFAPHEGCGLEGDVTELVKSFYEKTPFPNYDEHDSLRSLIEKSRRGVYARRLNETIPYNSTVLEVGCGTGQLANFLGIACRRVIGTDLCVNSLRLAEGFRRTHGLSRVGFAQMNLFRPCFRPESFDVVLCNGVLHHTSDPRGGFQEITRLLRPGGYIVVGLYNRYGRLLNGLRRAIFRLTGGRGKWLDPHLRSSSLSEDKRRAWFADQYRHPHESTHTIGQVLGWFEECGLEFVRGVPSVQAGGSDADGENLFEGTSRGTAFDHLLVQGAQIITGGREGGFFIMIGRKPGGGASANPSAEEGSRT
jgi:SAM-dependent methyltransferase